MATAKNRSISTVTSSGQVVVDVDALLQTPEVREMYRVVGDIVRKTNDKRGTKLRQYESFIKRHKR